MYCKFMILYMCSYIVPLLIAIYCIVLCCIFVLCGGSLELLQ